MDLVFREGGNNMNNYDENGFYKESSLVTIPRREYDRLIKSEKELQRMKKLNRPPDVEYRKKSLFGWKERR